MKKNLQLLICFIILLGFAKKAYTQENTSHSVLAGGNWYKLGVTESGVYKINQNFLLSAGIINKNTDPRTIKIYGNGGGMLPQLNSSPRIDDLQENSIYIFGEDDAHFNKNDFVLFYAEGPHVSKFSSENKTITVEQNIYSDTSYYYITADGARGKRIEAVNSIDGGETIITYDDFIYHETESWNILAMPVIGVESGSGREWYGEQFENKTVRGFDLDLSGIDRHFPIKVFSSVLSSSTTPSNFQITLSGIPVGAHSFASITEGAYNIKGLKDERYFEISLSNSSPEKANLQYEYAGGKGFLNQFNLNFKRSLRFNNRSFQFRSFESVNNQITRFQIDGVNTNTLIWDITDKINSKIINYKLENSAASFGIPTEQLKEFIVFDHQKLSTPKLFGKITNQNIHSISSVDFIIITHPAFISSATNLADFRRNNSGLSVEVIPIDHIYNEFSSGKQDVTAIRDFLRMVYKRDQKLKYVLLFGDCSFDYKNRMKGNTNFVPVYQSRESLHPIRSYSSDDYFGFLEDNEGNWEEDSRGDHTLELGIGRIPCETKAQAENVVNKIINYSNNRKNLGDWRNRITFVADDGDANTHLFDAERLVYQVDTTDSNLNIKKIYLSAYPQLSSPDVTSPKTKAAIDEAVRLGSLILNYTGHGGESGWTNEKILETSQIKNWNNKDNLPLFVTATCEFGKYDNPVERSGAELALDNPRGGAIALVTTTRPVFSSTNFLLNKAFYEAAFKKLGNKMPALGDILRYTKNNSLNGSINRNFALLGDPSLTLAYPENDVSVLKVNHKEVTNDLDTLKALEEITLEGVVTDFNENVLSNFNGVLKVTVFDKNSLVKTLGDEETPVTTYSYKENVVFKGNFKVSNGKYNATFRLPKNINYQYGQAKISLYAYDDSSLLDAKGSITNVIIGGSSTDYPSDNTPPVIKLYLNDSSFVSGSKVNPNPFLFAEISDESGVNITHTTVGQDLKAFLISDENSEISLNDYYEPSLDDYKSGKVSYPFYKLPEGNYSLTLKAWDIFNNSSQQEIEFTVVESSNINISELFNFPNPFSSSEGTTFSFTHDNLEDDIEMELTILNLDGKVIKQFKDVIYKSEIEVSGYKWNGKGDFGRSISNGVYIYRLEVRSLTNKNKGVRSERLVLIN